MTQNYTGMKKGISLVEMVIAIILFALLAVVTLKYSKNWFSTDLVAKKALTAAATDQAAQLVGAWQIYNTETGLNPTSITDLNGSAGILTQIPNRIAEMSLAGWTFSADLNGSGNAGFQMLIDLNATGAHVAQKADEQYCAIFNREFNQSVSLAVSTTTEFFNGLDFNQTRDQAGKFFCYKPATTDIATIYVIVP